jgi:hypothetical protein
MCRNPAVLALLLSGVASAGGFVGQASVIGGDTLEIHGTRIDAPEGQPAMPWRGKLSIPANHDPPRADQRAIAHQN